MRKKLKESGLGLGGDTERKATKRSYTTAIEATENLYKQSIQGNEMFLTLVKNLGRENSAKSQKV